MDDDGELWGWGFEGCCRRHSSIVTTSNSGLLYVVYNNISNTTRLDEALHHPSQVTTTKLYQALLG